MQGLYPVTGPGLNCVIAVSIWEFIKGFETLVSWFGVFILQNRILSLPVPWAKFLPLV